MKKFVEENSLFNWCTKNNAAYLLDEWDYEKNGNKNPHNVSYGSNVKFYWKCKEGHSYSAPVYRRTIYKSGCKVCANLEVRKGFNDLKSKCPELMDEWDYEKNTILPDEITYLSHKKVWWKCKHGHSWPTEAQYRASKHSGCPYCLNQKAFPGFNDVGTLYPEIKIFWDYEKNVTKPEDYPGLHSNKKVWFKCEKGHSWSAQIADFTKGTRCPYCSNRKIIKGFNDLFTIAPNLEKEWDFNKNIIDPYRISYGSKEKAWWKCLRGHSWEATINSRVRGNGCPECAKETQSSLPEKALFYYVKQVFPDAIENPVLKEISNRELDVYIPSLKIGIEYDGVNWHKSIKRDLEKDSLCAIANITLIRLREKGCPKYFSKSIKIECERIHSNVLLMDKPINLMFKEIGRITGKNHSISADLKRDLTQINELFVTYQKENSLAKLSPDVAKEWNYERNGQLKPDMFSNSSNQKVWWKCHLGHEWQAVIGSRTGIHHHNGCPVCSGRVVLPGFNDLESQFPNIAKEWNYEKNGDLKPNNITALNGKKVSWICPKGHHYDASIRSRTKLHSGCPICSGQKPDKGKNDFETLFPNLAKEWDCEKNGDLKPSDVLPGSERVVWWKCPNGHSYDTQIAIRAKYNCCCPVCSNKRVVKGINDLETLHPELAAEWNYEKNKNLLPSQVGGGGGSHKKVWWKCKHGHEWEATLASRISLHTGCPTCAIERTRKK